MTAVRSHGHRVVAGIVTACAACYGLAGMLFPADPMSPGQAWGAAMLGVSVVYAAAALRVRRDS